METELNIKAREELGRKLKTIREKKGYTQSELSELADINVNYYARIERGEVNFSFEKLYYIINALKIKSSEILPF
jgi:transcriptional regulator with XRE-family HTH domain